MGFLQAHSLSDVFVDLTLKMKLEFIAKLPVGLLLAKQRAQTEPQLLKRTHGGLVLLRGFQHQIDRT